MTNSALLRCALAAAACSIVAACAGGGSSSRAIPSAGTPTEQSAARSAAAVAVASPTPAPCTPIVTVNPATAFPTRTARSFSGGSHLNLDATGCDYGIYLGPASHHVRIADSKVHGSNRISIIAEGADDVQIQTTATDGGAIAGIELINGATGSIALSSVTNTQSGIIVENGARGTIADSLVSNTSFIGINILGTSTGTVSNTIVDNAKNVGSGVAVQTGSTGTIRNVAVFGQGLPTALGPQFGFFFAYGNPNVTVRDTLSVHNQTGYGVWCVPGYTSSQQLTATGNRAIDSTVTDYDVRTSNCPAPPAS
jgi:Right handed beta helix region